MVTTGLSGSILSTAWVFVKWQDECDWGITQEVVIA
jgi:hypothetical protein